MAITHALDHVHRDSLALNRQVEGWPPVRGQHSLRLASIEQNIVHATLALHGPKSDAIESPLLVVADELRQRLRHHVIRIAGPDRSSDLFMQVLQQQPMFAALSVAGVEQAQGGHVAAGDPAS